ncbi:MAG: purine-nucleoside phosphorylase [Actinobacteria bacterium]|nr:purine-nucleoside phosphorylase [Actinomycetota bacterium]
MSAFGPVTGIIQRHTQGHMAKVAVILGSGLSDVAAHLTGAEPIPYSAIDGMPVAGVKGHEGALYAGEVNGVMTLVFAGRAHLYEGRSPEEVTYAVRAAVGAGVSTVILTNAAGATTDALEVGAPCLISDHLNLTGQSPLTGPNDDDVGPRFLDLTDVYPAELRDLARSVDPRLQEGVYAGLAGPTYETPAEVRMLRSLGADLVGMSTVHEAIAAHYLKAKVLGISVVSNKAAGLSSQPLAHAEVTEAGMGAVHRLNRLLSGVIEGLKN